MGAVSWLGQVIAGIVRGVYNQEPAGQNKSEPSDKDKEA